jgi:flagellar basal body-associated protein FliL
MPLIQKDSPGVTMPPKNEQNKGERHKPVLLISAIVVILVGIFVLILFFFHSGPSSKGVFRPGTILVSQSRVLRTITGIGASGSIRR